MASANAASLNAMGGQLCAVSIIQLMLKFLLAYQEGHYIAPRVVLYAYDCISIVYANFLFLCKLDVATVQGTVL